MGSVDRSQSFDDRRSAGTVLGFPLAGFSLFQSLLLSFASAFFTFFLTTFVAIISLLVWNVLGGHTVNFADTYRYVGLPAGLLVLVVALPYFGSLWVRAKMRK
jgi:ABC-type nickel/cobalt efflux system permease component RcnA